MHENALKNYVITYQFTCWCANLKVPIIISYPFHIAKCAVTPHWTPLSIHPLCCCYTPVCFHTECRISAFWRVRFKKRSKIEQKDIITPMHCLAFPSALFGAPFHIDNRTIANCGFWLEYASKTPLEVGADLPRRMRLFWLRCQIMRLWSVHIKPHYSQNAFDSALLAWYERGIKLGLICNSNSSLTSRKKYVVLERNFLLLEPEG